MVVLTLRYHHMWWEVCFKGWKFIVHDMISNKRKIDDLQPIFCVYSVENDIVTWGPEENNFKINKSFEWHHYLFNMLVVVTYVCKILFYSLNFLEIFFKKTISRWFRMPLPKIWVKKLNSPCDIASFAYLVLLTYS